MWRELDDRLYSHVTKQHVETAVVMNSRKLCAFLVISLSKPFSHANVPLFHSCDTRQNIQTSLKRVSAFIEIYSLILNTIITIPGTFEVERSIGWKQSCNSRACPRSIGKTKAETGSSCWLCQPFPIHKEDYPNCKFLGSSHFNGCIYPFPKFLPFTVPNKPMYL